MAKLWEEMAVQKAKVKELNRSNHFTGRNMNLPRCLFGSASLGEKAIVAGGCDPNGRIVNLAELYDSESGTWETLPSMIKPRKMCSGCLWMINFDVIGGIGGPKLRIHGIWEFQNYPIRSDGGDETQMVTARHRQPNDDGER
ncbi:hypothetical protein L1887_20325 [Cichorium endivia]|nr:hypothetical protein L1887_20325 [Cichorium endivia]